MLTDNSGHTNAVKAEENTRSKAVGPTVCVSITIEGITVEALVDTGSQSTIISRSLLHEIGQNMKSKGQPLPIIERPTVHLFGKDVAGGGRELVITAQLQAKKSFWERCCWWWSRTSYYCSVTSQDRR